MTSRQDRVVWIPSGFQPAAIGFVPSQQAWERLRRERSLTKPWPGEKVCGHTTWLENDETGESMILVCVGALSERDALQVISTLVHEAVHVWQFCCQHMGETSPGIEVEAYAIQHITMGLIEAYTSTQGKDRKWL